MEYNTIKDHPDFLEMLEVLGRAQQAHERNMNVGAAFLYGATALMTIGIAIIKLEKMRQKKHR